MKPSVFTSYPWSSTFQKAENESIAQNIMKILSRTGNTFRKLTWKEYKTERQKDKDFSDGEKPFFDEVLPYCASPEQALKFSPDWRDAYIKALKKEKSKTKTPKELTLHFGAVAPSIKTQLKKQGYKFDGETVKHFQKDADAISRLLIRHIISRQQANMIRNRLHINIIKHIRTF